MNIRAKWLALGLSVIVLGSLPSSAVNAQDAAQRLVRSWDAPAKLADGTETTYRYEVTYDYASGTTLRRTFDLAGNEIERVELAPPPAPFPGEVEEALKLIYEDEAVRGLAARSGAVIDGGFILFGDQHPACALPARCLQFDVIPPDRTESLQFIVVDMRTRQIVERNLFPDL